MKSNTQTFEEYMESLTEWEAWLVNNTEEEKRKFTGYDHLCELAVQNYGLDKKSRKQDLKDQQQYFLLWWKKNRRYMKVYRSSMAIGKLVDKDHSTILHNVGSLTDEFVEPKRKPSLQYEFNTECIKDFLDS